MCFHEILSAWILSAWIFCQAWLRLAATTQARYCQVKDNCNDKRPKIVCNHQRPKIGCLSSAEVWIPNSPPCLLPDLPDGNWISVSQKYNINLFAKQTSAHHKISTYLYFQDDFSLRWLLSGMYGNTVTALGEELVVCYNVTCWQVSLS